MSSIELERLLHGTTLEDKLAPLAGPLPESVGGPMPPAPGRPPALAFRSATRRARLPSPDSLRDPSRAGELLHAFANHELLAIELMALALLRYDMAPRIRRELAATLSDEQRHLRGYISRMGALGTAFGDHPVSRFFWDALASVADPASWHAGMGLTLEQANLDFMTWYGGAFREAGDDETAGLLETVRRDEIAHVARGLRAFGDGEDLWSRWSLALVPPLAPRRARGPTFDRLGRQQAGLPAPYIERLLGESASRGRPPDVWFFDVTAESDGGRGLLAEGPRGDLARGLATLPIVLASQDDIVLVPEAPPPQWLERLREAGLDLPRVEVVDPRRAASLPKQRGQAHTWAPGQTTTSVLPGSPATLHPLGGKCASARLLREVLPALREAFGSGLIEDEVLPHVVCSPGELDAAIASVRATHSRVVVKADVSSSGRERIRLLHPQDPTEAQSRWMAKRLARGPLRVEPWLDGVLDLSLHPRPSRWVLCRSDAGGRFRAAMLGRPQPPSEIARFLSAEGRDSGRLDRLAAALLGALEKHALPHPFGVDAMVVRTEDGLRLHPLLEVNPRWTMGRVTLRLERLVHGRSCASWVHLPAGKGLHDLAAQLPMETVPSGSSRRIRRGALATSSPGAGIDTVLVVTRDRASLEGILSDLAT